MALAFVIAGCSSASTEGSFALTEFSIDGPTAIAAGVDSVDVSNVGEFPHTLVVTDSSGEVILATQLIQAGETTTVDVDLAPGTYSFTCRIVTQTEEGNVVDHFEEGMHTTVTISG